MRRRIPTVEEAIPRALAGLAPRSRNLYAHYLRLLADRHGHRKIDQLTVSDITELGAWAQAMAVRRRTSVNGTSAREHAIAACRRLFDTAIADGYLLHNPAKAARKPPRGERRLIEHVAHQALAAGVPALTPTTFAEVPWNAPYYRRCGFHVIDDEAVTPGLRSIQDTEAAHGLNRWPRVSMRRDL